ncbi:MAG: hypothetical protein B6U88_01950 [Candidatus Aenigmarchaeota archaeon ex4484_56]|nr:MAG: hypothetical protein B6U88_01950 [Candidatus Aenigmarchaeota archaeon ex4484_56]
MVKKIKVGVFKFTSCSGCEIEILTQGKKFFDITEKFDFKYIKILKKGRIDSFDICFVEGAVSTDEEINLLKEIRKKTKYLIALGSCAVLGGISALKNKKEKSFPIDKHVEVDYRLRGCPVSGDEFIRVVKDIAAGKTLRDMEVPVCYECKRNKNTCLIKKGEFCAGPITYSGCRAICPENNVPCIGCRGIMKDANIEEWTKKMKKFKEEIKEVMKFKYEP